MALQKLLQPSSAFHHSRDIEQLRSKTLEVQILSEKVPESVSKEWQEDLNLALKGIVQEKKKPKIQPKPELIVEEDVYVDLYEYY